MISKAMHEQFELTVIYIKVSVFSQLIIKFNTFLYLIYSPKEEHFISYLSVH